MINFKATKTQFKQIMKEAKKEAKTHKHDEFGRQISA